MKHITIAKLSLIILCMISILVGCSSEDAQTSIEHNIEGKLHMGYFYQEDMITLITSEGFKESTWDSVDFDFICQDLSCGHKADTCSAKFIAYNSLLGEEKRTGDNIFSFVYGEKRIIVDSYLNNWVMDNEEEKGIYRSYHYYKTDIYEAAIDGSNRKLITSFDGEISSSLVSHAAVLYNGKLYFGGKIDVMTEDILDVKTNLVKSETAYVKHAFFEVDLENYSVQVIGTDTCPVDNGYTYQVHRGDEWIYLTRMNGWTEKAEWYAVNPKTEEIVNIINLESQAPYIIGVIDDVIYAERENVVYRCDWLQNETLEEFYTVDDTTVVAEVLDEQIWIATDKSFEAENNYIEYTILDNEGNKLQTNYYPEYFTFLDMIDDKVIYYRPFAEQIEWWCEKDNLSTLESSICIGEYCGINEE